MSAQRPEISIIIPTLNEEIYLPVLLDSLKRQTYKDYEIIVSDAHSDDRTARIAEGHGCRLVTSKRKGPGHGRNEGARKARGRYLMFMDSDVYLDEDKFLEEYMSKAKSRGAKLGHCKVYLSPSRFRYIVLDNLLNIYYSIMSYIHPASQGLFIFVSKELFDKVDGFDEKLKLGEDIDFLNKVHKIERYHIIDERLHYSDRRIVSEGMISLVMKYMEFNLAYMLPFLKRRDIEYEFGKHGKDTVFRSV